MTNQSEPPFVTHHPDLRTPHAWMNSDLGPLPTTTRSLRESQTTIVGFLVTRSGLIPTLARPLTTNLPAPPIPTPLTTYLPSSPSPTPIAIYLKVPTPPIHPRGIPLACHPTPSHSFPHHGSRCISQSRMSILSGTPCIPPPAVTHAGSCVMCCYPHPFLFLYLYIFFSFFFLPPCASCFIIVRIGL